MPIVRNWTATLSHGVQKMSVTFHCPFYDELLMKNGGMLNSDFEAHALWDYYGSACMSYDKAKRNIVLETDLSLVFTIETARAIFIGTANKHGVEPAKMANYWPMINRQRMQLGSVDPLPEKFKFRYWEN